MLIFQFSVGPSVLFDLLELLFHNCQEGQSVTRPNELRMVIGIHTVGNLESRTFVDGEGPRVVGIFSDLSRHIRANTNGRPYGH